MNEGAHIEAHCAGVDEVGRGPLAGPVVAAAVVLDPRQPIDGLADSKRLSARRRETLAVEIRHTACAWALGEASVAEIDAINILQATLLAMQRAVAALSVVPQQVFVDGNRCPELTMPCQAIVGGDNTVAAISAASIIAKVHRDALLVDYDRRWPAYGFAKHKGYGTQQHRQALDKHGPCPIHRHSYAPVRRALAMGRPDTEVA